MTKQEAHINKLIKTAEFELVIELTLKDKTITHYIIPLYMYLTFMGIFFG